MPPPLLVLALQLLPREQRHLPGLEVTDEADMTPGAHRGLHLDSRSWASWVGGVLGRRSPRWLLVALSVVGCPGCIGVIGCCLA
ncbi:hypothetical protein EYF80_009087 [Liparis tanakae]|uniref:Uncharacterized protein n=1 Tax=Liparis tanakae TaxID=230148 RepID=A0A4Z2IRV2_9TELE|nr:hypothetical protein EYF80_009087 [Liparis tanakae]